MHKGVLVARSKFLLLLFGGYCCCCCFFLQIRPYLLFFLGLFLCRRRFAFHDFIYLFIYLQNYRYLNESFAFQPRLLKSVFKVDRLQIIVVAKKYIYVSQLFISRMPKMRAIPQLVSAPLNPIPIAEHFRRSHPPCEHSRRQHI